MKKINDCIVFSDDIERILQGYNALDFNYCKNGIIIPNKDFIKELRRNFKKDVNKIFDNKTLIINEAEMMESLIDSISDIYRRYPHSFIRQNL